jgi:NAD(P)-dependent dehydrogenase (short-subunit alcohol dehydrogenase family)
MSEFAGETALITGATNGIGRGIARALAREGARLIAVGLEPADVEPVVQEIADKGADVIGLSADLATADGWRWLLDGARAIGWPVSLFVHSASPKRLESDTIFQVSEETWDAMVNTNLRSGFFLGREIARDMVAAGIKGRMLYITSQHRYAPRNLPHYSAAKAGQEMLVKEMAKALGRYGIRVNGIAPGAIPGGGFDASTMPAVNAMVPLGRPGTPDDIAAGALVLLSNQHSAYITGEVLAIDGGIALHNWIALPKSI